MANLAETINYDTSVYQLETVDPVQGGPSGISNAQAKALANRTAWLKKHVEDIEQGNTVPVGLAKINSPAFTGTPTAPTPPIGDSSLKIANTDFVQVRHAGTLNKNVAGSSNVTLDDIEAGYGILFFNGALTGNIAVIVPSYEPGNWIVANRTTGSFTLTVKTAAGSGVVVAQGKSQELFCDAVNVYQSTNDFTDTSLTGAPTAPAPASGSNDSRVATSSFVWNSTDGMATVNVAGGSNVTLTAAQAGTGMINLQGALTANISVIVPSQSGQWIFVNGTTGGFNVTVKTATGSGPVLPSARAIGIYSDGINVGLIESVPVAWGQIAGTLANQTDLQNALNSKASGSHTHAAADVTSGVFSTARLGTGTQNATTYLRGDGTWAVIAAAAAPAWGGITGTLSNQTDLQTALNAKAASSHTHAAADVTSGIFAVARLGAGAASAVNYLRGDGNWAQLSWGEVAGTLANQTDLQNALNAKAGSSHTHAAADITSGVLATARLGTGAASTSTFLRGDGTWGVVPVPAAAAWGGITGTLANQTDLQNALNAKANLAGATFTGAIAAPSYNSTSSRRYKDNIVALDGAAALSLLAEIRLVGYRLIADGSYHFGVVAEDLADGPLDFVVNRNADGEPESVNYQPLFVIAARAVQALEERMQRLEAAIWPVQ